MYEVSLGAGTVPILIYPTARPDLLPTPHRWRTTPYEPRWVVPMGLLYLIVTLAASAASPRTTAGLVPKTTERGRGRHLARWHATAWVNAPFSGETWHMAALSYVRFQRRRHAHGIVADSTSLHEFLPKLRHSRRHRSWHTGVLCQSRSFSPCVGNTHWYAPASQWLYCA